MAISWKTIVSFLLAAALALGLREWAAAHVDPCGHYLAGDHSYAATQEVKVDKRTVTMPCSFWMPRQTYTVQFLMVVDFAVWLVFLVRMTADAQRWLAMRRAQRGWTHPRLR